MNHAEKCPVCNGKGKTITVLNWNEVDIHNKKPERRIDVCNGCQGKGWVTIEDGGG